MIGVNLREALDGKQQEAMLTAISTLIDECLEDLIELRNDATPPAERIAGWLPPGYRGRYDGGFLRKFLTCLIAVAGKLYSPAHEQCACVAEELALYVILQRGEGVLEFKGIPSDPKHILDEAFEDLDFEWLYDPASDGMEHSPAVQAFGMANLGFSDWFKPFREDQPVHPYVQD